MIPADFDYERPRDLKSLSAVLSKKMSGDLAILAGGHSLIPELKLRKSRPGLIVDIGGIPGLNRIEKQGGDLVIGAMAPQAEIMASKLVAERAPLLIQAGSAAGDPMIRRRGTLVGALCSVEPGGDWFAACLALDAQVTIVRKWSKKEVPLKNFAAGPKSSILRPGEFVSSVRIPKQPRNSIEIYRKVKHIAVGWSVASIGVSAVVKSGRFKDIKIGVGGAFTFPQRVLKLERLLQKTDPADPAALNAAISSGLEGVEFQGDYYASAAYRKKRLSILLSRTLREIAA